MISSTPTFGRDVDDPDVDVPDPFALLGLWLPSNTDELRPLMTLSTIDLDGLPDARSVLLSLFDADGLHFHTGATSRKAAQLGANPSACATLAWPDIGRQVVVRGAVARERDELAATVFASRSAYLRTLAWANTDETAQRPAAERRRAWAQFQSSRPEHASTPPPGWIGFVLAPRRFTFWRGDADGPSNRVEYRLAGGSWSLARLPG